MSEWSLVAQFKREKAAHSFGICFLQGFIHGEEKTMYNIIRKQFLPDSTEIWDKEKMENVSTP